MTWGFTPSFQTLRMAMGVSMRLVAQCVPVTTKLTSGGYNRFMCVEYGPCRAGDALTRVFGPSGGRCERLLHGREKHHDVLVTFGQPGAPGLW